ncbi:MAG TPA: hypothetical protein VJY35_08895 [Candidatus Eisenbacteria bacterium]|nr:hypothetical protein [Candidatus Eisenbacteria bacterium]
MNINVQIDTRPFDEITRKREKRLAFAAVNALNKTGERIQQAEHARARKKFIIRKESFFFGSPGRPGGVAAKLKKASVGKARPFVEVIAGLEGDSSRLLYPTFEEGGTRKPFTRGAKKVAIPILGSPARPTVRSGVPPAFTFAGLKLRKYKRGKAVRRRRRGRTVGETVFQEFGRLNRNLGQAQESGVYWKGQQRTFLTPQGVRQRIGPRREDTRMIWGFTDPFPIDTRLEFKKTALEVADQWFREEMERETVEALVRVRP